MKIYCISDNIDTNIGLRLVGINGVVIHEEEKVIEEINRVRQKSDIGILLITRKLAELVPDLIDDLKLSAELPLVLEIPDRHVDPEEEPEYITKYVQESIGIKI
ncbi:V/A-type H+-transporting ATPase subunit F [Halanaerobium saccharolyticum]|uniref:V/A-type H+-transporting ATPase subunit F n=1 Tax=Halanaerobium saccharolyticum TaxID=43595 RepID=A0A4R7YWN7_9FIRM|nr:V-type ATP synthase subunit F [Halanaerobium saccharolyticum]RAK07389.1 V/A-type H+-transporting ATPase subunit F [Halanaerobium saccharolyticum]TDW02354.1 V/A-type H+-transporting ATPase subunit F [Halanaerobium saccharolyticum]TDX59074.1 V/A-type H+-transporting ATPase subunit F [Halanaerobium saccharolyticum]